MLNATSQHMYKLGRLEASRLEDDNFTHVYPAMFTWPNTCVT